MSDVGAMTGGVGSAQHLRNLKIAIEFKYLMKHAPGGVFIVPEFENIRRFHGVIFIRRGIYRDGVFRFVMELSSDYSSLGSHPKIHFTSKVYSPLVDPETGILDISADPGMRQWHPEKHFIVSALTFLKSIFYLQDLQDFQPFLSEEDSSKNFIANKEAFHLLETDADKYYTNVGRCVTASLDRSLDPVEDECTIIFTEPKPAHDVIRRNVLGQVHAQHESTEEDTTSTEEAACKGADLDDDEEHESSFTRRLTQASNHSVLGSTKATAPAEAEGAGTT